MNHVKKWAKRGLKSPPKLSIHSVLLGVFLTKIQSNVQNSVMDRLQKDFGGLPLQFIPEEGKIFYLQIQVNNFQKVSFVFNQFIRAFEPKFYVKALLCSLIFKMVNKRDFLKIINLCCNLNLLVLRILSVSLVVRSLKTLRLNEHTM